MKFAVFSHCTIDTIELDTSSNEQIGGAACYCGITARNLKFDAKIHTKFENALSEQPTTRFKITISGTDRTLYLLNTCEPIEYSKTNADGIVISPVYHEITNDMYKKINKIQVLCY